MLSVARREADKAGDRKVLSRAALILGIGKETLSDRIKSNEKLRSLYLEVTDPKGPPVPTGENLNREPVVPLKPEETITLIEMLTEADRTEHEAGLRKMGLSKKLLDRIRNLDGLAPNTGSFFAISLDKLSRSYYVQMMELMGLSRDLYLRLSLKEGAKGYVADDEARALFNRNYTEMVKEAGRAFEIFLRAAEALVEMMIKSKPLDGPNGPKKKPGWAITTAPKAVMPPTPD